MTAGFADEPLVDAEPVPDTGAFAEPASMAERRDHLTEVNQARREIARLKTTLQAREDELSMQDRMIAAAVAAERERIRTRLEREIERLAGKGLHSAASALARAVQLIDP